MFLVFVLAEREHRYKESSSDYISGTAGPHHNLGRFLVYS